MKRIAQMLLALACLGAVLLAGPAATAADGAPTNKRTVTYKRGNITVIVSTDDAGNMLNAQVLLASYNAQGMLVWLEMYVYKPLENETILGDEVEVLAEKLLAQPVIEESDLSYRIHLFRHKVLWEEVPPGAQVAPELTEPSELSPDGA